MSLKVTIGNETANQFRDFPCLRLCPQHGNVLLFKNGSTSTIVYSRREENIGTQYTRSEYSFGNTVPFEDTLTLRNAEKIDV